jgi:hypothetical protein
MSAARDIDGLLVQWGDRLFYPGNRIVPSRPQPRLGPSTTRQRAAWLRERIAATVQRRAPQVMVKVTGGGRNMKAIVAHLRYISKNGRLEMEDELGQVERGKAGMHAIADDWRLGGTRIPDDGAPGQGRREAFNIILSMPRGTDPLTVLRAAREFVQAELADHKVAMVLHDHQANPHVHLSVRAESRHGKRLNPRKADLHRWRETFAEKLRGWGVEAEATRQATRGRRLHHDALWRVKARADGRLGSSGPSAKAGAHAQPMRAEVADAWMHISRALARSGDAADMELARSVARFRGDPSMKLEQRAAVRTTNRDQQPGTIDAKQVR